MKRYSFGKAEHLCLTKDIESLFAEGTHSTRSIRCVPSIGA